MIDLPDVPTVSTAWASRLEHLLQTTAKTPPSDIATIVLNDLGVDLSARYGGVSIPHPFGKASGQLSRTLRQVEDDVHAGIAFVVLKTVVAEDASGTRSMEHWVSDERNMVVEKRLSTRGREGWTITWKGRGWDGTLEEYLHFFGEALSVAAERDIPVIPSVKYQLPYDDEPISMGEFEFTTTKLLERWQSAGCDGPLLLEENLSPTLAAHNRSDVRSTVLHWLETNPGLIHSVAPGRIRLGVKVMNALFDDEFQVEMVRTLTALPRELISFLVVFNRLVDPELGVAYGGWDLSDRNFRVLDRLFEEKMDLPALSATGNICSGRVMLDYAMRGCENGQLHTFFQLPVSEFSATGGSRCARALHTLLLHPTEGLVVWLRFLHEAGELEERNERIHFLDVVDRAHGILQ